MYMNGVLSRSFIDYMGVKGEYVITFFGQTPDHFNRSSEFRLQAVFVLFLRHAESRGVLTS